jgi:hypothetical protein
MYHHSKKVPEYSDRKNRGDWLWYTIPRVETELIRFKSLKQVHPE